MLSKIKKRFLMGDEENISNVCLDVNMLNNYLDVDILRRHLVMNFNGTYDAKIFEGFVHVEILNMCLNGMSLWRALHRCHDVNIFDRCFDVYIVGVPNYKLTVIHDCGKIHVTI